MATAIGECSDVALSEYYKTLEPRFQARYREKIKLCAGMDPYCLKKKDFSTDLRHLPNLQFPDICNYLLIQTSFYTKAQMKAYKSMEAYNYFVCGWVSDLSIKMLEENNRLVFARVNHSQRSSATPLKAWVIIKEDGEVLTAHCNCMAGLGESCSHVGAILYAVEVGVRMRDSITCTMEKSKWLMPSHVNKITAATVAKIDFSSAKAKKMKLDNVCADATPRSTLVKVNKASGSANAPEKSEKAEFFKMLSTNFPNSAVLRLQKPYNKRFIPKSDTHCLPKCIMDYQTEQTLKLPHEELLVQCRNFTISLTPQQIKAVEVETRKQTGSRTWFKQRAGRITASRLKAVLRTNPKKPSKSLIKAICYPEAHKFSTEATRYGCKHEEKARADYVALMCSQHENFTVANSGLHLNSKWPYMGASPDGVVECECCGIGACEVKCPFCHQNKESIKECAGGKNFCLIPGEDGEVKLDKKHSYYSQVQAQLHIMEMEYCDFIVWNKNDIFIERITPDADLWKEATTKCEFFFRECILPEVLGQHLTKSSLDQC